jgi:glycosyltransferase involved in cell wall biosynthesis
MNKKRVLIITSNPLHNGPRLIREIDCLKEEFDIVAIGSSPPHDNTIEFIDIREVSFTFTDRVIRKLFRTVFKRPYLGNLSGLQFRINRVLKDINPDVVIVHPPDYLPYLINVSNKKYKVIFNAHEYHPLEFETNQKWINNYGRLYKHIYNTCLRNIDLFINVCESIAERCVIEYGKESVVIPNAATYAPNIKPTVVEGNHIRLIHHGVAIVEREIEIMIEAVLQLPSNYSLDLMLLPSDKGYYDKLTRQYGHLKQIRFIEPVAFGEIIPFINRYDIGIFNLPEHNYNYAVALPNKLFEYIQARLCIVVSPSVEMKRIVETYKLGYVSKGFTLQEFAQTIKNISTAEIYACKEHSDNFAFELSDNQYQALYLRKVKELFL